MVFVFFHPNARAAESDAFRFQAQPLFESIFAGQRDLAARPNYTMPRQSPRFSERPNHLACAAWKSCRSGDAAVGGHFALGDLTYGVADHVEHVRNQANVLRKPSSSVYCGAWPRSRRAAVVSA